MALMEFKKEFFSIKIFVWTTTAAVKLQEDTKLIWEEEHGFLIMQCFSLSYWTGYFMFPTCLNSAFLLNFTSRFYESNNAKLYKRS